MPISHCGESPLQLTCKNSAGFLALGRFVSGGGIDYAVRDPSGQLQLREPNESLFDTDVEISDDVFILKEEEAKKLREPPT